MFQKIHLGVCIVLGALAVACTQTSKQGPSGVAGSSTLGADGSSVKVTAPTPLSPTGGAQPAPGTALTLSMKNVSGAYKAFDVTYEVEIKNAAGAVAATATFLSAGGATTTIPVGAKLEADAPHTWRARVVFEDGAGPWSESASFRTPVAAFLAGKAIFDPLTGGFTVGQRRGGTFIPGRGWRSDTNFDGIDYDITTCDNCRLEFDASEIQNGLSNDADDKWLSMAQRVAFNDFAAFRNDEWKMTLELRADGDGTGMKLIWRNGCSDCGEDDPGDHTGKLGSTIDWDVDQTYHFIFDWTPGGYFIEVGDEVWFEGDFAEPYAPPNHRVSLGCYPRGETLRGVVFKNVKLTPR